MSEKRLLQAFSTLLYGHMEHDGEEVAINATAWLRAAEYVETDYPRLADLMRKTQAHAYFGKDGREGEDALENDLWEFDDESGVTDLYLAGEEQE